MKPNKTLGLLKKIPKQNFTKPNDPNNSKTLPYENLDLSIKIPDLCKYLEALLKGEMPNPLGQIENLENLKIPRSAK